MTAEMTSARPPSQALLDQRWQWMVFGCGLVITAIALLYVGDMSDCFLFTILAAFLYEMLRDGCQEMHRYVAMYGALSALACVSYFLRLTTDLLGRVDTSASTSIDGHSTVTQSVHSFFDLSQGLKYNLESMCEILMTLCCVVGVWLSFSAHRLITEEEADEAAETGRAQEERRRALGSLQMDMRRAMTGTGESGSPTPTDRPQHFVGKAYRIREDD